MKNRIKIFCCQYHFEELAYIGPIDGHDIQAVRLFEHAG
ncbi:MAG: hypothetical protein ACLUO4_06815 [Christensenellales bacterium]